jgi:FKBP-type peptidyl-prolyl cis-trans isomerase
MLHSIQSAITPVWRGGFIVSLKTWRRGVWGIVCAAFCGCQEPTQIIPIVAPGSGYERPLPPGEKEKPAEAVGETVISVARAKAEAKNAAPPALPTAPGETKTTKSGVKYETLKPGDGPEAKLGQTATVHYTGTLEDGTKFDSSRDRGQPFSFEITRGPVILGWVEGIAGMKVGERRKLIIPPEAGYGSEDKGKIPPGSTLIFDVELLKVQ